MFHFLNKKNHYCGPAVAQMALAFFGFHETQKRIARKLRTTIQHGTRQKLLAEFLSKYGLKIKSEKNSNLSSLQNMLAKQRLVIVNFMETKENVGHYAILKKIDAKFVHLIDPWHGPKEKVTREIFLKNWKNKTGSHWRWYLALQK